MKGSVFITVSTASDNDFTEEFITIYCIFCNIFMNKLIIFIFLGGLLVANYFRIKTIKH